MKKVFDEVYTSKNVEYSKVLEKNAGKVLAKRGVKRQNRDRAIRILVSSKF